MKTSKCIHYRQISDFVLVTGIVVGIEDLSS